MSEAFCPNDSTSMDGIGMNMDAVRALLAQRNNLVVDPDDPILAVVTINNAFLEEVQSLLSKHELALKATMKDATEENIKAVKAEANRFAAEFKEAAIESTIAKVNEHQKVMQNFLSIVSAYSSDLKRFCLICVGGGLAVFFIMVFFHRYIAG